MRLQVAHVGEEVLVAVVRVVRELRRAGRRGRPRQREAPERGYRLLPRRRLGRSEQTADARRQYAGDGAGERRLGRPRGRRGALRRGRHTRDRIEVIAVVAARRRVLVILARRLFGLVGVVIVIIIIIIIIIIIVIVDDLHGCVARPARSNRRVEEPPKRRRRRVSQRHILSPQLVNHVIQHRNNRRGRHSKEPLRGALVVCAKPRVVVDAVDRVPRVRVEPLEYPRARVRRLVVHGDGAPRVAQRPTSRPRPQSAKEGRESGAMPRRRRRRRRRVLPRHLVAPRGDHRGERAEHLRGGGFVQPFQGEHRHERIRDGRGRRRATEKRTEAFQHGEFPAGRPGGDARVASGALLRRGGDLRPRGLRASTPGGSSGERSLERVKQRRGVRAK